MSTLYFSQTVSAVADIFGNATAILRPDVGQYWAPAQVRISTDQLRVPTDLNPNFSVQAQCTLYHGAVSNQGFTTYIDSTFNGSGDTSSLVAGTIVMYGEALTVVWSNVEPGNTCILSVYGRSGNNLVELQEQLSPIPGARFAGNAGNLMSWTYNSDVEPNTGLGPNFPPTFATPGDTLTEITYAEITYTSNAAAANRIIGLKATAIIDGLTSTLFRVNNGAAQALGTVRTYTFSPGVSNTTAIPATGTGIVSTALPEKCILPPTTLVIPEFSGFVAADQWTNFSLTYRSYNSLTTVGIT